MAGWLRLPGKVDSTDRVAGASLPSAIHPNVKGFRLHEMKIRPLICSNFPRSGIFGESSEARLWGESCSSTSLESGCG